MGGIFKTDLQHAELLMSHFKLERRRLLNADFTYDDVTDTLTLNGFTDTFMADPNRVTLSQAGTDYLFTLADGVWNGIDQLGVTGLGSVTLTVDSALLSIINLNSTTNDQFDIEFSDFDFMGDISITNDVGSALFSSVTQQMMTDVTQVGTLTISGSEVIGLGNDNDFNTVSISNATDAQVNDINALIVDGAMVTDQVEISADGITLTGMVSATNVLLSSSSGVTQGATDTISATNVILEGAGAFDLSTAVNNTTNLAANINGDLSWTDADAVNVSALTSDLTMTAISGVTTSGNLSLDTSAGNGDITSEVGAVFDVTGTTTLNAGAGTICLTVANDFGGQVVATGNTVELVDINDLDVGNITAVDDIYLRAGDGATGTLSLNGDLITGATGQVLLQSDTAINQNLANIIDTRDLLLGSNTIADVQTGTATLNGLNNVENLAIRLNSVVAMTNVVALNIGDLAYTSICLTNESITGINIDGDLTLSLVNASLSQTAAVIVTGTTRLDVGTGDICLIGDNDLGTLIIDNANNAEIVDRNSLEVSAANVTSQLMLVAGDVEPGSLTLSGNITAGDQILLQANDGVSQTAGVITTAQLLLGGDDANESSGTFDLQEANVVNELTADLDGDLLFTSTLTTTIVTADYISACDPMDIESFIGLNSIGNVTLNSGGDILQDADAPITVTLQTSLEAIGVIWLTFADNVGGVMDLQTDNDFNTVVIVNASDAEITDRNDMTVTSAQVTGQLRFVAGAVDPGLLTLVGNVNADDQILLQARNGVLQTGGGITTAQLLLGGDVASESTGTFDLQGNNAASELGAELLGDLIFNNNVDVTIVKADYISVCDPLDIDSFEGLNIAGSLTITGTGGVAQAVDAPVIVGGLTTFDTTGVIWLTFGDCVGGVMDGLNDNDFNTLTIANASDAEIVDRNGLIVNLANVVNQLWLAAGDVVASQLTLAGNITAGDQVMLQAGNGVIQTGGVIATTQLLLGGDAANESTGPFDLQNANAVAELSANIVGDLIFNNTIDMTIVKADYVSVCDPMDIESFEGLNIVGNLTISSTADILQAMDAPVVVTLNTQLDTTGIICLTFGDCSGGVSDGLNDNDFMGVVTASGATVELVDMNTLTVGTITAVDDIRLESGDGDGDVSNNGVIDGAEILRSGALIINGNLTTSAADGQILLQSDGGVTQNLATVISTNDLVLQTEAEATSIIGDFNLSGNNLVNRLAGDIGVDGQAVNDALSPVLDIIGDVALTFVNAQSVEIADITYDSACGTTVDVCGLTVDGNLTMTVTGDITQSGAVVVLGTTGAISGNTVLTATGNICLTGADCDMDGANDNDFRDLVTATAETVEIVDSNQLIVGDILAVNDIFLGAGNGDAGSLILQGDLTTSAADGQVLLQSDTLIFQIVATSVITTQDLLIGSEADADARQGVALLNGLNVVENLASRLDANLTFNNTTDLNIGLITYQSDCTTTETICGVNLQSLGNLSLNVSGNLTQDGAVIVTGTTDLTATETICLTGADCDGDPLTTDNLNDFGGEVTATATTVEITDRNDLVVGNINAVDDIFLAAGDGDPGTMSLNGNLTTSSAVGQVLLQSSNGVVQNEATSVIDTFELVVGGDEAIEGAGLFDLGGQNEVQRLAGNLFDGSLQMVNVENLVVDAITYDSACMTTEAFTALATAGDDTLIGEIVVQPRLNDTIQADPNYNNAFDGFLTEEGGTANGDVGIAIDVNGSFRNEVAVVASAGDIFVQTDVLNPLATADDITVNNMMVVQENRNNILLVAGGDLSLNAPLIRGTEGRVLFESNINSGTISAMFPNGALVLDPGINGIDNAVVNALMQTQDVTFIFGEPTEQNFDTSVFWGINLDAYLAVPLVQDFAVLDSLNFTDFASLNDLLFGAFMNSGFESKSFYAEPSDGGIATEVTSQPIGNPFDNSGTVNDSGFPTASFTTEFLTTNAEFRNVMFVFNDAQINIFENASGPGANGLIDLNVAVEDFAGLARVGSPPQVEVSRTEFQVPQQVDVEVVADPQFFQTIVVTEDALTIQQVPEAFFVVIYFSSQAEADDYELWFGDAEREFDEAFQEKLKEFESFQWDAGEETPDANEIRQVLEDLGLELNEEEEAEWIENIQNWLKSNQEGEEPEVPRGVYKILEVESGKVIIQGEDVDRRIVPEPRQDDSEDFPFGNQPELQFTPMGDGAGDGQSEGNDSAAIRDEFAPTNRVAKWSALLRGEQADELDIIDSSELTPEVTDHHTVADSVDWNDGESANSKAASMALATTGIGLFSVLRAYQSKRKHSGDELESLAEQKAQKPNRNLFSRASRFARKHQHDPNGPS